MKTIQYPRHNDEAVATRPSAEVQVYTDDDFELTTKAGDFLTRLQLMTSATDACKAGLFPVNHYALVDGKVLTDLGDTVHVQILSWRPKALDMSGEQVVCSYNPKNVDGKITNPLFKEIVQRSGETNSKCMFGPEFLCWEPNRKKFVTLFMGSKTGRNEARKIKQHMGKFTTLTCVKISNPRYTWFAIASAACQLPFDVAGPDSEEVITKFLSPPEVEIEPIEVQTEVRER